MSSVVSELNTIAQQIASLRNTVELALNNVSKYLSSGDKLAAERVFLDIKSKAQTIASEISKVMSEINNSSINRDLEMIKSAINNVAELCTGATSAIALETPTQALSDVKRSIASMMSNLNFAESNIARVISKAKQLEEQELAKTVTKFTVKSVIYPKEVTRPIATVKVQYVSPPNKELYIEAWEDGVELSELAFKTKLSGTVALPVPLFNRPGKQTITLKIVDTEGNVLFETPLTIELVSTVHRTTTASAAKPKPPPVARPEEKTSEEERERRHRHHHKHIRMMGERVIRIAFF